VTGGYPPGWRRETANTSREETDSFAPKAKPLRLRVLVIERAPVTAEQIAAAP
jgi:hypothetical protein